MINIDDKKIHAKIRLLDLFRKTGKNKQKEDLRLPAGQSLIKEKDHFPVLDLGVQPEMDMKTWKLEITGKDCGIKNSIYFSLDELKKLIGTKKYTKDFHCVTRWSKYDVLWTGVPLKDLIDYLRKEKGLTNDWKHLIQYGHDGYSTNVPRGYIEGEETFIAFELEGKQIPKEHGTVRVIIPKMYAWKGSKFLKGLEFSSKDKSGFWETRGYHNRGDAFLEERYS